MKIAIQGHPTRGREIIQILENLGGKSIGDLTGIRMSQYYFINNNGDIDLHNQSNLSNYKLYTLEEFEKEFPFKIGDKVLINGINKLYEIIALEWHWDKLCYKLDNELPYTPKVLTLYKEMKKEKNVTLTLDKAKEWYKKGGELKEIALQAFTEEELTKVDLPKSWEEFLENYPYPEIAVTAVHVMDQKLTVKYADKFVALLKLLYLRDCYRQGWKPNYNNTNEKKYNIVRNNESLEIDIYYFAERTFSFQTREVAEEFLRNFEPLLKQADDLI